MCLTPHDSLDNDSSMYIKTSRSKGNPSACSQVAARSFLNPRLDESIDSETASMQTSQYATPVVGARDHD